MVLPHSYGETLLRIEGVSKAYGKMTFNSDGTLATAEKLILHDVNATIRNVLRPDRAQGQTFGLLGPSGRGKTQLFRIISGLLKPTTGKVLINSNAEPVKAGMVGVVPQHYPLLEHRRVLGNLIVAGKQAGLSKAQATEKAMGLLERFGLADQARTWPFLLSGGQRQRIAICQQLMCSEHFLLMDEPFSGLDPIMSEAAQRIITEVAQADDLNTIIVVSHDISAVVAVADTLWLLGYNYGNDGRPLPGATIVEEINLIELGLAWQPEITQTPEFLNFVKDMKLRFHSL